MKMSRAYGEMRETYASLGILICAEVNKSNTHHVSEKTSSYPLYRAAMGIARFKSRIRFIRFG